MLKPGRVKILLIEDDPFLISMYATKFEQNNYQVISAPDGAEGIDLALKERPDVILLDVLLPKINGFEVLRRLKSDRITAAVPVIMLTNLSQKNEVEQGMTLGANDYLVKAHFTPTEVLDKVKGLLAK